MSTLPPPIPADDTPKKASGLALASLICGIPGLCVFPAAIAAIVCGIMALVKAKPGQPKGMAVAGTVLGGLGIVVMPIILLTAILVPVLAVARKQASMMKDGVNLRLVEAAEAQYAIDHPGEAATLGSLIKSGAIAPAQLVSPLDERPEAQTSITADNADKVSSYILVPGFKNANRPDAVAAFVDPGIPAYQQKMQGIATVVYEDGHVNSLVPAADLEAALRKQTGLGIQELVAKQRGK